MSISLILLIAAGVCFVLEAIIAGRFNLKWWAIGVAFYLFSLAAA
ncbi:MAG TPA: hypothetical protein VN756_03790 [Solirubrobacterales bacterium]|nr:hypothetical protein [Solirubrobacterales bacterium]